MANLSKIIKVAEATWKKPFPENSNTVSNDFQLTKSVDSPVDNQQNPLRKSSSTDFNNTFDGIDFFSKFCGEPIREGTKEIQYNCPKCRDKAREIYVTRDGKWHCKHANCAERSGCKVVGGGPLQFLKNLRPDFSHHQAVREINRYRRNRPDSQPAEGKPKKTYKTLGALKKSMLQWPKVIQTLGDPGEAESWTYHFSNGMQAFAVFRLSGPKGKTYSQARKIPGGWQCGGIESNRPLFNLKKLPKDPAVPIFVVEGEKCAESLQNFLNQKAFKAWVTTSSQGARSPQKTDWSPLARRTITILPDNDNAGINYATTVSQLAKKVGAESVKVATPFGEPNTGYDIADEIQSGADPSLILSAIKNAEEPIAEGSPDASESSNLPSMSESSCVRFLESSPQPRKFLLKDFLPRLNVGVIAAPGGTGKGFFTLQIGLSVATGIKFLGKFDVESSGGVLYCNLEDDEQEIHRRFLGCLDEVLRWADNKQKIHAYTRLKQRFYSPSLTGKHRLTFFPDDKSIFKQNLLCLARSIPDLRLIILDPANRIMGGDFNRVEEVTPFIQTLEELATETNATILLVTHTNKASQNGSREVKHSVGAVLGSQSFVNVARWVLTLSTFDDSMRKKYQLPKPLETYVSLRIPKANYLAPGFGELHLERVTDVDERTGFCSGPLRLVCLGKVEKEVKPEELTQWLRENPGLPKTATIDAIKGKFGISKTKARISIDEAIGMGLIKEKKDRKAKNKLLLFPNTMAGNNDTHESDDE